ncbi:MAG: hypothetical protein HC936_14690 [Leptolyngbyaceae cyanobacterium SU_3_3]|nr:hypothetical protein [Leptolyngbyaceae cyanobacterium SU_3_3]
MTFLSPLYGLFLLCIIAIYWSIQQQWLRSWLIFLASLIFYASLQAQYIPLLLAATFSNFILGRAIGAPPDWRIEDWQFAQQDWNRRRLKLLSFGIVLNVLLLVSFKYIPFYFVVDRVALRLVDGSKGRKLDRPAFDRAPRAEFLLF